MHLALDDPRHALRRACRLRLRGSYAKRVLGDARVGSLASIWNGSTIATLRRDLNAGGSAFCGDCPLKLPLSAGEQPVERSLDAGATADVPIELDAPDASGRYLLKFDLVSEGIDWFEKCGSPTTTKPLWVY